MPVKPQDLIEQARQDMMQPLTRRDVATISHLATMIDLALALAANRNLAGESRLLVTVKTPNVEPFIIEYIKCKYTALGYRFDSTRSRGWAKGWTLAVSYTFIGRETGLPPLPPSQEPDLDRSQTVFRARGAFVLMRGKRK